MSIVEFKKSDVRGQTTQALAATGLAAGLVASSCCILPFLLLSMGIGGAWISNLTALAPYQPLFLATSATALGFGFWRAYRQRDRAVGSLCENPGATRTTKALLWLGVAAILAAMSVNVVVPLLL